jgi:hypothetical protein
MKLKPNPQAIFTSFTPTTKVKGSQLTVCAASTAPDDLTPHLRVVSADKVAPAAQEPAFSAGEAPVPRGGGSRQGASLPEPAALVAEIFEPNVI